MMQKMQPCRMNNWPQKTMLWRKMNRMPKTVYTTIPIDNEIGLHWILFRRLK